MIKPLSDRRKCLYRTGFLIGTTFVEGVICYVPDFSFKYHVFLIENGMEQKTGYCKSYSAAMSILEQFLKDARQAAV